MIYYTVTTSTQFTEGEAVQVSDIGVIETYTTGDVLGVVMSSTEIDETSFATKIYSAGGGGVVMVLASSWNGAPSRFRFVSGGRIEPAATGGDGWMIPDHPPVARNAGDIVRAAIYK